MVLTLEDKDLAQIDAIIKKTPFEFGLPLYQFFTAKISEQNAPKSKEGAKVVEISEAIKAE